MYLPNTNTQGWVLNINSEDLPSTSFPNNPLTSDFVVPIPDNVITCQPNEHLALGLIYFNMPNSYFNVESQWNKFRFLDLSNPGVWNLITITPKNYTARTLGQEIQTKLNVFANNAGITVAYDPGTNGYMITHQNEFQLDFNVDQSAHKSLGFTKDIYSSTDSVLISPFSMTLNPNFSVNLRTDLVQNCSLNTVGQYQDCLEVIPCLSANSITFYRPTSSQHKFLLTKRSIGNFRVRLTFGNELINLHGLHCQLGLQFYVISSLSRPANPEFQFPRYRIDQGIDQLEPDQGSDPQIPQEMIPDEQLDQEPQ